MNLDKAFWTFDGLVLFVLIFIAIELNLILRSIWKIKNDSELVVRMLNNRELQERELRDRERG